MQQISFCKVIKRFDALIYRGFYFDILKQYTILVKVSYVVVT